LNRAYEEVGVHANLDDFVNDNWGGRGMGRGRGLTIPVKNG